MMRHILDQDIIPEYAEKNIILPLDAYLWAERQREEFADFLPGLWDAVTWKEKLYCIPIEEVVNCIYYRKDVLRKLGISNGEIERIFS